MRILLTSACFWLCLAAAAQENPATTRLHQQADTLTGRAMQDFQLYHFDWAAAESIFDTALNMGEHTAVIFPADTAARIEALWLKSLAIDSTQTDLRGPLCYVYAMSLQVEKLKSTLTQFAAQNNKDDELPYQLADFARLLKARGKTKEAMEVYQHIANLYPTLAGIRCDMAYEYFLQGRQADALRYLDSCRAQTFVDETSWLNSATLYSVMGRFADAQKAFAEYSKRYKNVQVGFYSGLLKFAEMDSSFAGLLQDFLQQADDKHYHDEVALAKVLLRYTAVNNFTLPEAERLLSQNLPEYYVPVLLARFGKQYPNSCEANLRNGIYQCAIKNYASAIRFLKDEQRCIAQPDLEERRLLHLAYAHERSDNTKAAQPLFAKLMKSSNAFVAAVAKYFSAKILWQREEKAKAQQLFRELRDAKEKTKYSELAKSYL